MIMNRGTNGFVKGIGTGMAVGMAAGVAGAMMYSGNKKMIKKKAAKAVKTISGIVDDVQSMMR
jgi:gas vesicle protein